MSKTWRLVQRKEIVDLESGVVILSVGKFEIKKLKMENLKNGKKEKFKNGKLNKWKI